MYGIKCITIGNLYLKKKGFICVCVHLEYGAHRYIPRD